MTEYDKGFIAGRRQAERGQNYRLPFGKHVDWIKGYKAGYSSATPSTEAFHGNVR